MELKDLHALKSRYISRLVHDELVLVPLEGNIARMNEMFTLNTTARFIWEHITDSGTLKDMIALMAQEFEVEDSVAEKDILSFLDTVEKYFLKK